MEMIKQSCEQFLAELAGKAPTPGGGGTAALVGAAGVALGTMVGSLTIGKKKYAAVEADIQALNARADILRKELEALVQADAEAFAPLAAAYGLPKDTPGTGRTQSRRAGKRAGRRLCGAAGRSWKNAPRALFWWKNTPPRAA
ncbi:MAG: cyclodeaminase/cyclohydrolase family protein [Faecalibacterium sp.]